MSFKFNQQNVLRILASIAILAFIYFFQTIVLYLLLAIVLAFILGPVVDKLDGIQIGKFNFPRVLAVVLTQISSLFIIFLLIRLFFPVLVDEVGHISSIESKQIEKSFAQPMADLKVKAEKLNIKIDSNFMKTIHQKIESLLNLGNVGVVLQNVLQMAMSFIGALFSVYFMSFFFLKEKYLFYRMAHVLTPSNHEAAMQRAVRGIKTMLGRYFRGILMQILVYGFYVWAGLSLFGVPYAFTIGFFAGIINLVPYIGPFIAIGFGVLLSCSAYFGMDFYTVMLPAIYKVLTVFGIAIMLDNFVSYPLIFSNSLKAHPLEIFIVILMAATMGGIPAMVVAMPVYTVLRVVAKEFLYKLEIVKELTKDL